MERKQVLEDYWNLRKLLNLGNKVANERSEIVFKIEPLAGSEYRMLATAISKNEIQKIELVRRDSFGNWERSGFTKLKVFENFCAEFLNEDEEERGRTGVRQRVLSDAEVLNLASAFQNEIDQLLINYSF